MLPNDTGVGFGNEIADACRMPVITPRQTGGIVQPLLNNRPFAFRRQDERMQIDLKAISDGIVVDSCREPACANQRFAVEPSPVRKSKQFLGSVSRMPPSATTNVDAQFIRTVLETAFERS